MSAVITGIGVVAPTGIGVAEHWKASLAGVHALSVLPESPIPLAGRVPGFEGADHVDPRLLVQTDRWTWFTLAASDLAFSDARFDPAAVDPLRLSVVTASGSGGNAFGQREIEALWRDGPRAVSAYQSIGWFYAAASGQLSIKHQLKGPCGVVVADAAGGIDAVTQSLRLLRDSSDLVLVGAAEAPLSPYALACQSGRTELSRDDEPRTAYRPFHPEACGFVPGEGGAMLVLESPARAAARGAEAYAEIVATASTHDGHHPVDPPPDSAQLVRVLRLAVGRAGLTPAEIDVVFADGLGDPRWDALEAEAIRTVFGRIPVAVPKTMTGRLCSGGAALDIAWAALALEHAVIPPSVHLDGAGTRLGLDVVTEARERPLRTALVLARGAGGFNAAAVLRRPPEGKS
ncbi:beta-ketoacyl synthase N-terminal-like domain-containing protein [Amycolatopsis thailandensis]|uniref:beta-ketoacyl synthase N-terminal-like domain-containing protein n=1 Tax=Amycolatopsis thailandensis TaxID=589330 RepID=UPI00379A69CD